MTPRNIPLLGSGYRPTIWCVNPSCHAPVPVGQIECPECGEPVYPIRELDITTEDILVNEPATLPCGCTRERWCIKAIAMYDRTDYERFVTHRRAVVPYYDRALKIIEARRHRNSAEQTEADVRAFEERRY